MTEEMINIINSPEKHIVVQAFAGCFPKNTKYFNGIEWKNIQDYKYGEYVLQFNPTARTGELVKPIKYIKRKNTSNWYKINLINGGNVVCSGDHDILYYDNDYSYKYCNVKNCVRWMKILTPTNSYVGLTNTVFKEIKNVEKIELNEDIEYCFEVPSGNLILKQNEWLNFCISNCGKSSTMLEYVKAHPNEKILFLVYNREMMLDFKNRLKGVKHNCDVKTIHSLAYRWYLSQKFPKKELRNTNIIEIQNILKSDFEYSELSSIKFYFEMFLTSDKETPYELDPLNKEDRIYFKYVDKLFKYYSSKYSASMPHNAYLKMFQLAKVNLEYETIINDEVNDINQCMLSILTSNLDKKIIAVGDSYQMINAFNFNCDGLRILENDYKFKRYGLTKSFRVSEEVSKLASRYLSFMYDDTIKFNGLNKTKFGHIDIYNATKENQIHLLCRTRLGGLKQILDILDTDEDKKIYYVGGLEGFGIKEIERILSYRGIVYLGGQKYHINQLRAWLKEGVEDAEIQRICSIYNFLEKRQDAIELLKNSEVKKKEQADIVVLTSHSSKGLTLKNVVLNRDFPTVETIKAGMKLKQHEYKQRMADSEGNLLYVALTRATDIIDIGKCFNKDSSLSEEEKIKEYLDY